MHISGHYVSHLKPIQCYMLIISEKKTRKRKTSQKDVQKTLGDSS